VGELRIDGAAANVVPGRIDLTVDVRAPESGGLAAISEAVRRLASEAGAAIEQTSYDLPVPLSPLVRDALHDAASAEGVPILDLASGAGHDAGILATAGVQAGMLFVRSRNGGVSHRPEEFSDAADIAAGAAVLTRTLRALCGSLA
jgi:acetylornithine deacetylase/succinyl-diaminopimelate desuccinylase-like protein